MMLPKPTALSLFLLFFGQSCALYSQTPDTAMILGEVRDPSNALVSGAKVGVSSTLTGLTRTWASSGSCAELDIQ